MRFGAALDLWHKGILHDAAAVPIVLASDDQLAALGDYGATGRMTDGQKAWLKAARDKITFEDAEYVLKKLKEAEENDDAV